MHPSLKRQFAILPFLTTADDFITIAILAIALIAVINVIAIINTISVSGAHSSIDVVAALLLRFGCLV